MLVQGGTLALIVATAIVGVFGMRSIFIFGARLVPAAVALGLLLCSKWEIFSQAFGVGS